MRATLVATWSDGVYLVDETTREHELSGCSVGGLISDGRGGALAIVDGRTLRRRSADGTWISLATADCNLSCCVMSAGLLYVGTDDARVFRLTEDHDLVPLRGFERVEGRDTWTAGQMLVDGRLVGPPLGIRSMAATLGGVLLANVHVGGIPRSTDAGETWHPTIAVDTDVHEVRGHPTRENVVAAAAGAGLCLSSDGGATWSVRSDGLHAPHCSAVAFVGDDVLITASESPFASKGRIYRHSPGEEASLTAVEGLPEWTEGVVDTHCLTVSGSSVAFVDQAGNVYVSRDAGASWSLRARGLPSPSGILLL